MIKSYFCTQYQELNSYFSGLKLLLESLPEDVKDDLKAHTGLGRLPENLGDVEKLLEEKYPPYPGTCLLKEHPRNLQPTNRAYRPLLRPAGYGFGIGDY